MQIHEATSLLRCSSWYRLACSVRIVSHCSLYLCITLFLFQKEVENLVSKKQEGNGAMGNRREKGIDAKRIWAGTTASQWVHPMVTVPKGSDLVRITVISGIAPRQCCHGVTTVIVLFIIVLSQYRVRR